MNARIIATSLAMSLLPALSAAQACPAHEPWAMTMAEIIAHHPVYAELREEFGVGALAAGNLRFLADTTDASVCESLVAGITQPEYLAGEWGVGLFEANGLYMMVFYPLPVNRYRIRVENGVLRGKSTHTLVAIFRADLSLAARWLL